MASYEAAGNLYCKHYYLSYKWTDNRLHQINSPDKHGEKNKQTQTQRDCSSGRNEMRQIAVKYLQCDVNVFQFYLKRAGMKRKMQPPMSVWDFSISSTYKGGKIKDLQFQCNDKAQCLKPHNK